MWLQVKPPPKVRTSRRDSASFGISVWEQKAPRPPLKPPTVSHIILCDVAAENVLISVLDLHTQLPSWGHPPNHPATHCCNHWGAGSEEGAGVPAAYSSSNHSDIHIETLCTYLSFISFVATFWLTWSHKIEININASCADFQLGGHASFWGREAAALVAAWCLQISHECWVLSSSR